MKKDMLLRTIASRLILNGSSQKGTLKAMLLLVIMVIGATGAWGQAPVEITTDTNGNSTIDDNEKKLYLIQTNAFPSFYIAPQSNKTITTNNILGEYLLWYFLDAGTVDGTQYYYIVNKSTDNNSPDKYIYNHNGNSRGISIITATEFAALTDDNKEKCKFKLVVNNNGGTTDFYNINVKASQTYYGLNKQNGSEANANPIRLTNTQYINDTNSKWKFIPFNGTFTYPTPPFTPSTDLDKHYYEIHNIQKDTYYAATDATPDKVIFTNQANESRAWYFKEAASDTWYKYYYIINPATGGKYMYYEGTADNTKDQTNAISVKDYNSANEDRYQFVVVQAARGDGNGRVTCYAIIPKLLIDNLWTSSSLGYAQASITNGLNMGIINSRGATNGAHWDFKSTTFNTVCDHPVIAFDRTTGKASITTATLLPSIYYTTDGTTPSSTHGTLYNGAFPLTEQTTVKAIVTKDGYTDSEVTTLTIGKVATPTIQQETGTHNVSITTATPGATIYYTTDGTTTPTTSSTLYTGASEELGGKPIKAIAVKDGMINSAVGSGTITLSCANPVFTKSGDNLTISCPFPTGATIYYTTNGDTPTSSSTEYSTPLTVVTGDVIKAIAVATGYNDSEVVTKKIFDDLTPTDGKYLITNQTDFDKFVDMASTIEGANYHYVLQTDVDAGSPITEPFTGVFEVDADANGNFYKISGLSHPLFNTISNGTVKNVMLKNVQISGSDNVGAIAGEASGYTRIYNCGILPSSNKYENESSYVSSSDGYCGGLVGWLKDDSRVINCFSYANITGGTTVAGIVGYNDFASTTKDTNGKYTELKTAIVNCMFYGNITGGTTRYPVYGGKKIPNNTTTGINNYDYYRAEASLSLADNSHYNCSWPAKEEYLTKYEYYRYLLNSNRELCGWWVGAPSAPSEMSTTDVQAVPKDASLMAKWVLDPSIAPYPILKPAGKYYSVINQDPNNRVNPVSKTWESRTISENTITTKAAPDTEGQKLGSITVTINKGGGLSGSDSKDIPITAMDIDNNDFCYGKIQLPYYNSIFGNPNSSDWATRYGGNYGDKVVVGWEITSVTGGTEGTLVKNWQTGYDFADRDCTNKDKERIFAQGGYYYVPNGVSAIEITAKWADAIYLDNSADHSYDRVYMSGANAGTDFAPAGHRPTTLGNGKTVETGTISNIIPAGDVYEKVIVLVGNHQYRTGGAHLGNKDKGCTILSADFDLDDEPDYSLIWQLGQGTNRQNICPIRFDFLPVIEMGMAMKEDASTQYYSLGCYLPLGHYEVTETSLIHFGQFEFGNANRSKDAPLILNGGIYDQYCKGTKANTDAEDHIDYIILGGNVYMPSFSPGAHVNDGAKFPTRHCAVNVIGGRINNLYLTGNFNNNVTPNIDNPHCYLDGGNFKQIAAAGKEGINGDVYFKINHSVIEEFYGGSTLADKLVTGNINVTVDNSKITKYCGGPKFGNMTLDANNPENSKTITTNATGTTFGVYYGGGNGGTSYVQYSSTDVTEPNGHQAYSWDASNKGNLTSYTPNTYRSVGKNYMADYEMEIVNTSTGTDGNKGIFRTYFYAAQFSATNTGPITNILTDCKVLTSFYGGGNLGGVKGDVTSTLTDTKVLWSAFGAGYSASVPEVTIYNKDKTPPLINVYTGLITPTPEGSGNSTTYTWTNETSLGGQTLSTSSPAVTNVNGKNYFYTEESLEKLGSVAGNVSLTIKGNSVIGTAGDSTKGNVYGGGESSYVTGAGHKVTINLQGETQVLGNVFGGGDKGLVEGSTVVNIEE